MKQFIAFIAWCAWVLATAWFLDGYETGDDFGPSGLGFAVCLIDFLTFTVIADMESSP